MQRKWIVVHCILVLTLLLCNVVQSTVVTNLCSGTPSCNCTLTDNITLSVVCSSTPSLTQIPVLDDTTLQSGVTQLTVSSLISGSRGPLTTLPTNLCTSYPNVAALDLSSNAISGSINASELNCLGSKLTTIDFSNNLITDMDLNFLKINNQVQTIDLAQNSLTTMPIINSDTFVFFPTTVVSLNFSYNQIVNCDLWPLFVKTNNFMTIDMTNNVIVNFTNYIPIYVKQFSDTPDPRSFYLNNNQIQRLSDLLLEQYGACETIGSISTSFFIVGVSNMLLTDNPLICDCESYNLVAYIQDNIYNFPQLNDGTALLTQATCTQPAGAVGQKYISSNYSSADVCANYTLPNQTNIFCSVYTNSSAITITPPTYWTSATTLTTIITNPNETSTSGGDSSGVGGSSSSSSGSPAWYIVLGVVLGLAGIILLFILGAYLYRDRLFPGKYGSGFFDGVLGKPEQETQTAYQIVRNKPSAGTTRDPRSLRKLRSLGNSYRERRASASAVPAIDVGTNTTTHVVKGIPIPAKAAKIPTIPSQTTGTATYTSASELNVTQIPLTPSKRAKLLPQVKSGIYVDTVNKNLLNTSAGLLITNQRERRRSSIRFRRPPQNSITPLSTRPHSMIAQKSVFDQDDSINDEIFPTQDIEPSSSKPSKPLRALPLLNITVTSAWTDTNADPK